MYFLQDLLLLMNLTHWCHKPFFYVYSVFNSLGLAVIYANNLPFITDQMIGASSEELSAAVH